MTLNPNTFIDITEEAGISWSRQRGDEAIAVSWLDYNGDGFADLWISGHGFNGEVPAVNSIDLVLFPEPKFPFLYINNGDGTFTNVLDEDWRQGSGGDTHGTTWIDYDNDGDSDVFISSGGQLGGAVGDGRGQPNIFFETRNSSQIILTDEARNKNINNALARTRASLWFDRNRDGLLDLVSLVAVRSDGTAGNSYFEQQIDGTFIDRSLDVGFNVNGSSRYAQLADLTGDGVLDVVIQGTYEFPLKVYDISSGNSFVDVTDDFNFPLTSDIPVNNQGNPDQTQDFADHESARDTIIADFNGDGNNDIFLVRSLIDIDRSSVSQNNQRIIGADLVFDDPGEELGYSFQTTGEVGIDFFSPNGLATSISPDLIYIGSSGRNPTTAELEGFVNITSETTITASSNDNPRTNSVDPVSALALSSGSSGIEGIKSDRFRRGIYIGYDSDSQTWQVLINNLQPGTIRSAVESTSNITSVNPIGFSNTNPLENALEDELWLYDPDSNQFVNSSVTSGLTSPTLAQSTVAGDFDNDKDIDIYLANSYPSFDVPNILYENQGDGTFEVVEQAGGAESIAVAPVWLDFEVGAKLVTADYDNNGFLDIFSGSTVAKSPRKTYLANLPQLFKNQGNDNNWLQIQLEGIQSNRDGIGTQVRVTSGGTTQIREQGGGTHNFAQNDRRLHFGLGDDNTIQQVEIRWYSGVVQRLNNVGINQILNITEPFARNITGNNENENIQGNNQAEFIEGRQGNDTLNGLGGRDRLIGGENNDVINGGTGSDTLNGNTGNDTLRGGEQNDRLFGGNGFDRLEGNADDDTIEGNSGNDFILGGSGYDSLIGNDGKDTINGDGNDDYIEGGSGRDTLRGNNGDDTLNGGADLDRLEGGSGNDFLLGEVGGDLISGGLGKDTIRGGDGQDIIRGQQGDDLVIGDGNNDTIKGGGGFDTLEGSNGNDNLNGEGSRDTLYGGNGNDTLKGGNSDDLLDGGSGRDTAIETGDFNYTISNTELIGRGTDSLIDIEVVEIFTGGGNNLLDGSEVTQLQLQLNGRRGQDTLIGGSQNDKLKGGTQSDLLTGGEGRDRFIYTSTSDRNDTITDFSSGVDAIVISASGFEGGLTPGVLNSDLFVVGNTSLNSATRFIYNTNNDRLLFDPDGTGSKAAIVVANFTNNPTLNNEDIEIIK